jgi:ankyrin repeat protein
MMQQLAWITVLSRNASRWSVAWRYLAARRTVKTTGKRVGFVGAVAGLCLSTLLVTPIRAHESDQFTLPPGRRFADLGPHLNQWAYEAIKKGVEQTNARIREAVASDASDARLAELRSSATVTVAVTRAFPSAFTIIENFNHMAQSRKVQQRYPGTLVGYKEQFTNIYENVHFPLDPRQIFRIWHSATIHAYGTYLGTDKLGHFTDMGRHYYHAYQKARSAGQSKAKAIQAAVAVGNEGLFFAEEGALGYLTAGAYSNADMAANYLGFLFYRNLTEPVALGGQTRQPMLARKGGGWQIAPHVSPDSDFFRLFISDHLNEALNPSLFEKGMRDKIHEAIEARRARVLWRYRDEHDQRRPPVWFKNKAQSLRTYFGQPYGHRGTPEQLISVADACYSPTADKAEPTSRTAAGHQPLHQAVLRVDIRAVGRQLQRGADVNALVQSQQGYNAAKGNTPLHLAARDGHLAIAKLLIQAGAAIEARNQRGETALHKAAGQSRMARLLINQGASINAEDQSGQTPLHWSARDRSDTKATDLLVQQGAAVDRRDHRQRAAIHVAAMNGQPDAVDALIAGGAKVQARTRLQLTPLHLAAAENHTTVMRQLIQHGASPKARDVSGWTPLHDAARHGQQAAVQFLLAHNTQVNEPDANGSTALHLAARHDHRAIALKLIDAGAMVNQTNELKRTPLHEAAFSGDPILVRALIEAGARHGIKDNEGKTPRQLAREHAHTRAARLLQQRPTGPRAEAVTSSQSP